MAAAMDLLGNFRLEGKRALVTGCSRGIGQAMAIALAEAGADIIGVSASLAPGCATERGITRLGRSFAGHTVDFANRAAMRDFATRMSGERIDILVNNAGTISRAPVAEHGEEAWDAVMEINLNAQFLLSQAIGRRMIARRSGKIIFTASLLSFQGGINVAAYASSKGAIAQLTKALANEWAQHGINVNAIAPGYIATDNTTALRGDETRNTAILARIPTGRWGQPDDLKGPTVFLASSASDYVNGTVLVVDGGWMGR
jgi:2-deoxy-D-gluconate 3-dehydrogenase